MAQREIEIDEALAAVEDALDCLDAAARDLKSARNWGLLDMFGGGFLISAFKRGRMQTAQEHLNAAQRALSRLADELDDVQGFSGIGPDVGDFLLAADWLFDNVFMESRERVARAIAQCEDVRDQLLALRRPNRGAGNGLPGAE